MKYLVIGHLHKQNDKRVSKTVNILSTSGEVFYQFRVKQEAVAYNTGNITWIPVFIADDSGAVLKRLLARYRFERTILRLVKTLDYDVLHINSFFGTCPLKPFKIALRRHKEIIYDMHEYYPASTLATLPRILRVLKEKVLRLLVHRQITISSKVTTVSEGIAKTLFATASTGRKAFVVPNLALKGITPNRKNKEIVIVGGGPRNMAMQEKLLLQLQLEGFMLKVIGMSKAVLGGLADKYTGFLDYDDMMNEISVSSFSFISYSGPRGFNSNYRYSMPNKFFDSLAAGTPVVVDNRFSSMSEVVERMGVGIVIDIENPKEAMKKISNGYSHLEALLKNISESKENFIWTKKKERSFLDYLGDDFSSRRSLLSS